MKKPYQIESQRAVRQLEEMAADGNPAVQMVLPLAEKVGWLRQGVGELIRQAGLQLMELLMEEEVRELVGERSQPQSDRTASRWGKERGYCVVMGQKVPIQRPRVQTTDDKGVRLGIYEMFHRGDPGRPPWRTGHGRALRAHLAHVAPRRCGTARSTRRCGPRSLRLSSAKWCNRGGTPDTRRTLQGGVL